jgi:phosphoglycerate dehydrogenase-like enzyme
VEGTTVAIVGLGGIGAAVAQRALAFGMEVRALRRTDAPSPIDGVQIVHSLDDLLPGAAHVVLAAPATARTRHLIDADAFAKMTPGTHLVNIARGSLVDQDALRVALDDGTVAMATLDTVDPEPLPEGHWLYTHPQVRMTAHISWYTPQLQAAAIEIFIENIGRHRRGEPLLHVVDPHEGY